MSKQHIKMKKALSAKPGSDKYEVGYGKPPQHSQFPKGQSGNPRGRPRGAKNKRPALNEERLKSIILEEANRDITVRDGDRNVSVPMATAIVRSIALKAVKGDPRSQRLFSELLSMTEHENKALHNEWLQTAIEYKIGWENTLADWKHRGITGPEPLPHPDDIVIDMKTGQVHINGPMTPEEKKELDEFRFMKANYRRSLAELEKALNETNSPEEKASLEQDLELTKDTLQKLRLLVPDEKPDLEWVKNAFKEITAK